MFVSVYVGCAQQCFMISPNLPSIPLQLTSLSNYTQKYTYYTAMSQNFTIMPAYSLMLLGYLYC